MNTKHVIIVGAGIAGLTAAIDLSRAGLRVTVLESQSAPGGKIRTVTNGGAAFDAGPTVLTMRWVFEQLFEHAGASFTDSVPTLPLRTLARHAWDDSGYLDLFSDVEESADAIGAFAGPKEAKAYLAFCERARETYQTLEKSFICADAPSPVSLAMDAGFKGLGSLMRIAPFSTFWDVLGSYFADQRLRQLFARYATYVGSSPFEAPATLMLIADVERQGVWIIEQGMHALAKACCALAGKLGATFRFDARVARVETELGRFRAVILEDGERIGGDAVIINADPSAIATGMLGPRIEMAAANQHRAQRSLSAVTFCFKAAANGMPLAHHNVFFGHDYRSEFDDVFGRRTLPQDPTVYICAQDQGRHANTEGEGERLFCLVNAPAIGDTHEFTTSEVEACQERMMRRLAACGLTVSPLSEPAITTPNGFNRLFPGTGGALYGQANHGWNASFTRPLARTRCPGVYLAGGATHPGAGVPMAALSGRMAARAAVSGLRLP